MPVCVPTKELKNTATFTQIVRDAGSPVVVTKNGREAFVSMTPEYYEALQLEAARARLYREIDRAENDIAAGRTIEAHSSIEAMRRRYAL